MVKDVLGVKMEVIPVLRALRMPNCQLTCLGVAAGYRSGSIS